MDDRNANDELVGVSQNIRRIRELIEQIAETGFNVIVCGETGVGKEVYARAFADVLRAHGVDAYVDSRMD